MRASREWTALVSSHSYPRMISSSTLRSLEVKTVNDSVVLSLSMSWCSSPSFSRQTTGHKMALGLHLLQTNRAFSPMIHALRARGEALASIHIEGSDRYTADGVMVLTNRVMRCSEGMGCILCTV